MTPGEGQWRRLQFQGRCAEEANWLSDSTTGEHSHGLSDISNVTIFISPLEISRTCYESYLANGMTAISGNETGITHDALLTPGHALIAENCSETLLKTGEVSLSELQTTIASCNGVLHGPLLLVPTKKLPERYTKELAGSEETGESGYLAALDLSRNTVSFIPLAGSASKTR